MESSLAKTFGVNIYSNPISVLLLTFRAKEMRAEDVIDEGVHLFVPSYYFGF